MAGHRSRCETDEESDGTDETRAWKNVEAYVLACVVVHIIAKLLIWAGVV